MAKFWQQTEREKRATVGALGLFFGALLGANLGTLNELPLKDYVMLVVLLVGAVTTIQISVASERRVQAFATVAVYVAIIASIYLFPGLRPHMAESDLLKLLATLAIWLGMTVVVEATPSSEEIARRRDEQDSSAAESP